jgi:hypothetical protein
VLDLDSTPIEVLVERYVLSLLYFDNNGEGWSDQLSFLSASSVCEWNDRQTQSAIKGVARCNEDDVSLDLGKSKHEEVIALIS